VTRELDEQLLEQTGVRRRRLLDAVLWGRDGRTLAVTENVNRFVISLVVAALLCAGCVGVSFARDAVAKAQAARSPSPAASAQPSR
jgi:hypothetical protein